MRMSDQLKIKHTVKETHQNYDIFALSLHMYIANHALAGCFKLYDYYFFEVRTWNCNKTERPESVCDCIT